MLLHREETEVYAAVSDEEICLWDGAGASLTWFYTDGSLIYNEEFPTLPGEAPAGGAE